MYYLFCSKLSYEHTWYAYYSRQKTTKIPSRGGQFVPGVSTPSYGGVFLPGIEDATISSYGRFSRYIYIRLTVSTGVVTSPNTTVTDSTSLIIRGLSQISSSTAQPLKRQLSVSVCPPAGLRATFGVRTDLTRCGSGIIIKFRQSPRAFRSKKNVRKPMVFLLVSYKGLRREGCMATPH